MKLIELATTKVSIGTTTGQMEGYNPGTLQFATEGEIKGANMWDVNDVLGPLATRARDGYTTQGGHLFYATAEQIAAIVAKGAARLEEAAALQAKADELDTYQDINDLLRRNGNAAAAE